MAIIRKFVLPNGKTVDALSPEQMEKFVQKITDLFTPLAYEAVMKDLQKKNTPGALNKSMKIAQNATQN